MKMSVDVKERHIQISALRPVRGWIPVRVNPRPRDPIDLRCFTLFTKDRYLNDPEFAKKYDRTHSRELGELERRRIASRLYIQLPDDKKCEIKKEYAELLDKSGWKSYNVKE